MCCQIEKEPPKTFYHYFKPIAIISRCFGVFPLSNLHGSTCDNLKFSFYSASVFLTILILLVLMGLIMYFIFWSAETLEFSMVIPHSTYMWFNILEALTILYSFVSCFFCVWNGKEFVKLIKVLDFFDRQRKAQVTANSPNKFVVLLKCTIMPIVLGSLDLFLMVLGLVTFANSAVEGEQFPEFRNLSYVFFCVLASWQVAPIFHYLYFASTITENFRFINKKCSKLMPATKWYLKSASDQRLTNIGDSLRNIRYFHVLMVDAVKYLNLSYGWFLAVGQLYTILTFVIGFYLAFFTSLKSNNLFFYVSTYCFLSVVVVIVSHKTRLEVRFLFFFLFLTC